MLHREVYEEDEYELATNSSSSKKHILYKFYRFVKDNFSRRVHATLANKSFFDSLLCIISFHLFILGVRKSSLITGLDFHTFVNSTAELVGERNCVNLDIKNSITCDFDADNIMEDKTTTSISLDVNCVRNSFLVNMDNYARGRDIFVGAKVTHSYPKLTAYSV